MIQLQRVDNCVDLIFPAVGSPVPVNHGYALYAAVSRVVPGIHSAAGVGIFPIQGTFNGGRLHLNTSSSVRIRLPAERLPMLLPLAEAVIEIDGHRLRLGTPRVHALIPAPTLISRLVLIKIAHTGERGGVTPDSFLAAARKQLVALSVAAEPAIPLVSSGLHAGEPQRRIVRVKEQTHAGYAMVVEGLTADESIRLQEAGIGGRRLIGCGLFLPSVRT
ncbi:MAG: type I-MYXAN CRISPR-associated protein Cas6/Cmx6 [Gemmatimonadaceae bacterium]